MIAPGANVSVAADANSGSAAAATPIPSNPSASRRVQLRDSDITCGSFKRGKRPLRALTVIENPEVSDRAFPRRLDREWRSAEVSRKPHVQRGSVEVTALGVAHLDAAVGKIFAPSAGHRFSDIRSAGDFFGVPGLHARIDDNRPRVG